MAVRRSDLYLPANNEHMVLKAPTLGADVITLDMEDSVPPAEKAAAREMVKKYIGKMSANGAEAWVRINAWDTDLTLADWQAAASGKVTAPFTFTGFQLLDAIPVQ